MYFFLVLKNVLFFFCLDRCVFESFSFSPYFYIIIYLYTHTHTNYIITILLYSQIKNNRSTYFYRNAFTILLKLCKFLKGIFCVFLFSLYLRFTKTLPFTWLLSFSNCFLQCSPWIHPCHPLRVHLSPIPDINFK